MQEDYRIGQEAAKKGADRVQKHRRKADVVVLKVSDQVETFTTHQTS